MTHLQQELFCDFPESMSEYIDVLKDTEEYFFYEEVFCNIDEKIFAPLYCQNNGRPNAPINVMVSALLLKEKRNWSYVEMLKQIRYNFAVRAALGIFSFSGMPFSESTIFNFQNQVLAYRKETGVNLFEKVFDTITINQLKKYKIKTTIARLDTFMLESNIRKYKRLELLIEVLKRLYRTLSKVDKKRFQDYFSSYLPLSSERYLYTLRSSDLHKEMDKIGLVYNFLKNNLSLRYKSRKEYQHFIRAFEEHFTVIEENLVIKEQSELGSDILQSPDDDEATFRTKRNESYRGGVGLVVETAHPDNKLNLLTHLSQSPNNVDDSTILNKEIDKIKEKMNDLNEGHADGAFGSEENDKKMAELGITLIQTAIKGRKSEVKMDIEQPTEESDYTVTCPQGQSQTSTKTRKRFKAIFDKKTCDTCPFSDKCPTNKLKNGNRVFYFTREDYRKRKRHKSLFSIPVERRTLRANVEATVHEFTYNLQGHKLKVRGSFKAELYLFCMGIMVNFGRIYRYLEEKLKKHVSRVFFAKIYIDSCQKYRKMSYFEAVFGDETILLENQSCFA